MGKLLNKVALVTGGTSGIGLATAKLFATEGALVYITGRRDAELRAAQSEIGSSAFAFKGDMTKIADLDALFEQIRVRHGRLDVVFANAGRGQFVPLQQVTEAHFDETFALNVKGTLFTVQKALPLMGEGSCIVLNGSAVSVKGIAAFGVYSATKAAIRSLARTWSVELRDRRIRVNVVAPGTVPTPGYAQLGLTDEQWRETYAALSATIPTARIGVPDEVANAVLFLASGDSSYVNGIELFVDGGSSQI